MENQINVQKYVYEKVLKEDVVVNIPEEAIFFQEHNHRVIIGIFPQRAEWDNNRIYELKVVQVKKDSIEIVSLSVEPKTLSNQLLHMDVKGKSSSDFLKDKALRYLIDFYKDDRVRQSYFEGAYEKIVNEISGFLK